jgi:hypothetical protein
MAASATDPDGQALGINVMLGALCFQVVTLLVFSSLGIEFALRVRRNPDSVDMSTATLRTSWRWKGFLYGKLYPLNPVGFGSNNFSPLSDDYQHSFNHYSIYLPSDRDGGGLQRTSDQEPAYFPRL